MNMEKSTLRHVQIKVSYFRENNKVSKEEKQLLTSKCKGTVHIFFLLGLMWLSSNSGEQNDSEKGGKGLPHRNLINAGS